MNNNKTIAFTIPLGFIVRNLLRSEMFKTLKDKGYKIILFSTVPDSQDFRNEFQDKNVIIEHLMPFEIPWLPAKISGFKQRIFFNINSVDSIRIQNEMLKENDRALYLKECFKNKLAGKSRALLNILENKEIKLIKSEYYRNILKKHEVNLVFLSSAGLFDIEKPIFCEAKRLKITVIGMVSNWDHIPDKGKIYRFDKMVIWNPIQKKCLIDMYDYPEEDIFTSGIPQFDIYSEKDKVSKRADFLKSIGANPEKKLITHMTTTPSGFPNEYEIVEILAKAIQENKFTPPSQLLVRFHPRADISLFEHLKNYKDVIFERPGRTSTFFDKWNPTKDDMYHFMDILAHSDAIVNRSSTTTVDAAAFDTPVVCVAFDGYQTKDYYHSMRRYYDYNPYIHVVKTGGVRIAYSPEELILHLNNYLKNRELDSEGRKKILSDNCYLLDGKSGHRIAEFLMKNVR